MKIQKTTNLILNDNGAVNVEIYKRTNSCRGHEHSENFELPSLILKDTTL